MASAAITVLGVIGATFVGVLAQVKYGLLVLLGTIVVASVLVSRRREGASARCMPSCAGAARAVTYYGWSGSTSSFTFTSASYTARFAEHNRTALVAIGPPLRALLEAFKVARQQVPTPATATRTVPRPRDRDEWIAALRVQRGRLARRLTLARALAVVHEASDREAIIRIACRAELEPVLAGLDALDAARAALRLREALAAVHGDNLPQELRDAEISELETRLRFISAR
jgi:hypothetical protein